MFNKKADLSDPRGWISLIIGILVLVLGALPILNQFKILPFGLPGFLVSAIGMISIYLLAAIGIYLLIVGFMEDDTIRVITILIAFIVIAIGIIQILAMFKIIGFSIPFLTPLMYNILFVIEGIFLIIAAFAMI